MCLRSKQSSLFVFYALPSGGKSKDTVVHCIFCIRHSNRPNNFHKQVNFIPLISIAVAHSYLAMGICVVSSLFRLIFYYNCWNEHGWFLYGFEAPLIRIPNTFSMSTFGQNCINSNCFKQLQIIRSYSHLFDFPSFELMTTSLAGKGVEKWGEIFGRHGRRCRRLQRHRRCRRLRR